MYCRHLCVQLMDRCGSVRPAQRPPFGLICEHLRLIVERAEKAEARQPTPAEELAAPPRGYKRAAVREDSQLSEEMDGDGAESDAKSRADGASAGSDDDTESCESDGDQHADQMEDEEGRFPCPNCSDRLRSQSRPAS